MTRFAADGREAQLAAEGLDVSRLSVGYPGSFTLRSISFAVPRGAVVGVIGPNGSGKSTLLKAIAGVLSPAEGSIRLDGAPLRQHAERVAFVPQREDVNWQFPATAFDVVLMGRYRAAGWLRRPGSVHRELAHAALDRMGLAGMGGRHISQFSGGQQQRIFLARALVQQPTLVLLDEPFTGVDVENREVLHATIRDLSEGGAIILMATHDLDEVTSACSHVVALNGRLVAFGPTVETFTEQTLRATFGGRVAVVTR